MSNQCVLLSVCDVLSLMYESGRDVLWRDEVGVPVGAAVKQNRNSGTFSKICEMIGSSCRKMLGSEDSLFADGMVTKADDHLSSMVINLLAFNPARISAILRFSGGMGNSSLTNCS